MKNDLARRWLCIAPTPPPPLRRPPLPFAVAAFDIPMTDGSCLDLTIATDVVR